MNHFEENTWKYNKEWGIQFGRFVVHYNCPRGLSSLAHSSIFCDFTFRYFGSYICGGYFSNMGCGAKIRTKDVKTMFRLLKAQKLVNKIKLE